MYPEEEAALFELLIRATHDLAARCEQPGTQEENAGALREVARSIGLQAQLLSAEEHRDVVADCAVRLRETAQERGVSYAVDFADRAGPDVAVSWRELQIAEAAHDRACNPDSQALAPREQTVRHTLRMAAIAGGIADGKDVWRPLADMLLLAVRLVSAVGEEMPDRPIPRSASQLDSALGEEMTPYWTF